MSLAARASPPPPVPAPPSTTTTPSPRSSNASARRCSRQLEVRVLDDPERVAERILQDGNLDALADFLNRTEAHRAELDEAFVRGRSVLHAPIGHQIGRASCR